MKRKSKPFLPAETRIKPREGQSALFLLTSIFLGGKGGWFYFSLPFWPKFSWRAGTTQLKVTSTSVSSLVTKESSIISQLPVTWKRVFFSWNRRLPFEEDLRTNISESDGETNTPSLVCNSSAFAAVLGRILWQLFLLVAVHPWFSNELFSWLRTNGADPHAEENDENCYEKSTWGPS